MVNLTIDSVDLNQGAEYIIWLSQTLSGKVVNFLASQDIIVSVRWVSFLILFFSIVLIMVAMKITKPLIKWALIILSILLIVGLIIPIW